MKSWLLIRRGTFTTLCLRKGMLPEDIRADMEHTVHIRDNLNDRVNYIKHFPTDKLNEVFEVMMKGI